MDTSTIPLVVTAITMICAGLILYLLWPLIASHLPKEQQEGASITVHNKGSIVTLRNAPGVGLDVYFETSVQQSPSIVPTPIGEDREAEREKTVVDELRDPNTTKERRAEIEKELLSLGYERVSESARVPLDSPKPSEAPVQRPQIKPSSEKPGEPDHDESHPVEGADTAEGQGEADPQFGEDFYGA